MADLIERYKITANLPSVLMNYCNRFNSKQLESITEMIYELENSIESADVQPISQWISVKDRLPNDGERVLIYVPKTQNKYYVATFYTLRDEIKFAMNIYGMSYCWYANDVTHWQPLPEPPKDGEQND
jgi:hypothetical protein